MILFALWIFGTTQIQTRTEPVGVLGTLMLGIRETVILGVPPSRLRLDGVFFCGTLLVQVRRCSARSTSFEAQVSTHTEEAEIILSCPFNVIVNMQCGQQTHTTRVKCAVHTLQTALQSKMLHSRKIFQKLLEPKPSWDLFDNNLESKKPDKGGFMRPTRRRLPGNLSMI